jgi:serine/threonine protein kinase
MQLEICNYKDIIIEWIPYDQFNNIKEIGKGGFATVYSATWMDGPLECDKFDKIELKRRPGRKVALKCLNNSQNITNEFLNEVGIFFIKIIIFQYNNIFMFNRLKHTLLVIMMYHIWREEMI